MVFVTIPAVMALGIEAFVRLLGVPKISHHNIRSKSQDLIPQIDSKTILFLGDSRVEWGVKPIKVGADLDCKVINLALPGSNGMDILEYLNASKVYPKAIVVGYTPNVSGNLNHELDRQEYNLKNRIKEKIRYFLLQNFYLVDFQSLVSYKNGDTLYFKSHAYDELGGASVREYGDYSSRYHFQLKMYTQRRANFNPEQHSAYLAKMGEMIKAFSGKTEIVGVYMPVSSSIRALEDPAFDKKSLSTLFGGRFYDYSSHFSVDMNTAPDSANFYDGSHLSPQKAEEFSTELAQQLKQDLLTPISRN
jgi:hypothetical protein